jgi:hypothetical protein
MTMTRWTIGVVAAVMMLPAHGALKEADQERLLYMWSESAEVIVEGSIAALTTVDDPEARNAYVEVTVRVNTVQRGEPAGGALRVRIDDPLQMSMWGEGAAELGARGLWFLHRVQAPSGEIPFGYLIRYISAHEIAGDPIAADKLMRYVIEDSIDQTIAKDILKLLEPTPKGSTKTVELRLHYDTEGTLSNLEMLRNSGNTLYDQHVLDQAAALHRTVRLSFAMEPIDVAVTRTQAAVEERRRRQSATSTARTAPVAPRP